MKKLTETDISKAYEGKQFVPDKLRKIAIGSGNTRAVVYSRRITQSQGALIGITDELFNKWWDEDTHFAVYIDLAEPDNIIERCSVRMSKLEDQENGNSCFTDIETTQQGLQIFQNIMEYITG